MMLVGRVFGQAAKSVLGTLPKMVVIFIAFERAFQASGESR
jgi:hypothetical protein